MKEYGAMFARTASGSAALTLWAGRAAAFAPRCAT